MAKYWPWIALAIVNVCWFGFWEVRAFSDGASTTTLSASLRAFTEANWVFPWLAAAGFIGLCVHLYARW